MIRVFICPHCGKVRVVSKFLEAQCYDCGTAMETCRIPYVDWVELGEAEREQIRLEYWKKQQ